MGASTRGDRGFSSMVSVAPFTHSRHPQVDRRQGNTGGLGGAFAFFYGVGRSLPFPEMHPYKPSKRYRLFQLIGKLQSKFSKKDE